LSVKEKERKKKRVSFRICERREKGGLSHNSPQT